MKVKLLYVNFVSSAYNFSLSCGVNWLAHQLFLLLLNNKDLAGLVVFLAPATPCPHLHKGTGLPWLLKCEQDGNEFGSTSMQSLLAFSGTSFVVHFVFTT